MNSILDLNENFHSTFGDQTIICFYVNATHNIQVLRLNYFEGSTWERVIFPGERLMFEAHPQGKLEIKTSEAEALLMSCQQLRAS